jgi:hypothetical protein
MEYPVHGLDEERASMSIASPLRSIRPPSTVDVQALKGIAAQPVAATGFWTAVLIPLAYPVILAGGLSGQELSFLPALLALNAIALYLGRDHNRDAS